MAAASVREIEGYIKEKEIDAIFKVRGARFDGPGARPRASAPPAPGRTLTHPRPHRRPCWCNASGSAPIRRRSLF